MAEPNEIIDALEGLALFCRPPLMAVDDRSRWMAAWVEDLRKYPIQAIRDACNRWRTGDNARFPMPGQLLPLVRACHVKGADAPKAPEAWRPLTDAEYQQLTLTEKIRHHQIMQAETLRRTGPQWREGKPCPAAEMPVEWHEGRAKAENHGKEVRRLRDILAQHQQRPAAE